MPEITLKNIEETCASLMLSKAIRENNYEQVKLLVTKDNVNKCNFMGIYPIYEACYAKNPRILEYLIQMGANTNIILLNKTIDTSIDIAPDRNTPLMIAIALQSHTKLKILLNAGASPNMPSNNGTTPLMLAAHLLDSEAVKILSNKGANQHIIDSNEKNVLYHLNEHFIICYAKNTEKNFELADMSDTEIQNFYEIKEILEQPIGIFSKIRPMMGPDEKFPVNYDHTGGENDVTIDNKGIGHITFNVGPIYYKTSSKAAATEINPGCQFR